MVEVGSRYKHFKGGEYRVVAIGLDSEDLKKKVVYEQLYEKENFPRRTIWVRGLEEFEGFKETDNGKIKRFEEIEE